MIARQYPDDDWRLWILLRDVSHETGKIRNNELRKYGISSIQAAVIYAVKNAKDPVTPSEISRWLDRERATVTEILNRMQNKGLIEKVKDLKQRNQIRIKLTDKGEGIYLKTKELISIHKLFSCFSVEERTIIIKHLSTLYTECVKELTSNL